MKAEHWRILIADTQCPHRLMADEKISDEICFCSLRIDPEDNPYCSFTNCRIKEV